MDPHANFKPKQVTWWLLKLFGAENRSPNFDDFAILAYVREGPCIKGRGGGSGSKKFFLVILVANLVYFHPLFTEFENSVLLTQNWQICPGG